MRQQLSNLSKTGSGKTEVSRQLNSAAATSLDPSNWSELRQQAHRMLDDMLGDLVTIRERPVWQPIPDAVRARFQQTLPLEPTTVAGVHEEFMTSILPFTARNAHPGFMGWVQGGGTPVGMLAEMLAAGLNANVGGRDQIPLEVEAQVTDWMRTLFGFPAEATGLFATGTSMASFIAVVVARDARLGCEVRRDGVALNAQKQNSQRLTAYASTAVHGCIARALDFAGLGSDSLRLVPVDNRQRIDLEALTKIIAADRAAGFTPFLAVGTAGTVDTGAIDDLDAIAAICAEQQLWFHVDGASGALAMLAPDIAPRLKGIERADSLAFDFHKWAQVPYDAGFILVRDGTLHKQAFATSCAYLSRDERGLAAGSTWPCDLGPELSRGFRALKTWATLKVFGTKAIGNVISRACELARYLEGRILASQELELIAPVQLNVVCFRYRFAPGIAAELCDKLNRQIVIRLQESGAVAPSTTAIGDRLTIRAAIVNHRTSRAEIDTLIEATLTEGRVLQPRAPSLEVSKDDWQPWRERDARVRLLDERLNAQGKTAEEVALRVERATLLAGMGRELEARTDHLKVIELDPSHLPNLLGLGKLLVAGGQRKAAQMVYEQAVNFHPNEIVCQVNLGSVLLEGGDPEAARAHYEAALRIDPEFPEAHGGMYYALTRLGELDAATLHQRKAFGQKSIFRTPYKGNAKPIRVLLLVSSTGGNTPIEKLLDDRVFETYVVVADFYDPKIPLPPHQLVVNGIGDSDQAEAALIAAEKLLALTSAPVLNPPAAVLATARCENAHRLSNVPGLITPATAIFRHAFLAGPDGASALIARGFSFPLLARAPGFHMGQHFVRIESPAQLASAIAQLPGEGRPAAEVLAIEYLDARGADGCARKYRVMMVGGKLYPLHLAISQDWKIHYFSADMADRADHRDEEADFLANMPGVLGRKAMNALERLQEELGLDYGGVDFGLSQSGDVLLFEANATMVVEQPSDDSRWDYRRAAVARIHAAVRDRLINTASSSSRNTTLHEMIDPLLLRSTEVSRLMNL